MGANTDVKSLLSKDVGRMADFAINLVSNFYFRPCRDQYDEVILEYFRCRCGTVRKRVTGTGYSNPMQHIRREHPSYSEEMLAATPGQTGSLAHYVRHSAQNLFGWLEWLVKCNLPLSFCEIKLARRYTRLQPVSVETLRRVMDAVTRCVEHAIAAEMPEEFGIIFDGWSHDSEHYIAVFACYEVDGVLRCPLLCMAPLVNDETDDFSAASHQASLATMLARDYQKRLDQVLFLVGDNCGVNRRLATLMGVPLVGCASHRLNRAVAARLSECAEDVDMVQALMVKLRTLHHSAKLRFKTDLRPIIRQQTRWGSTFAMINRYFELLPFIDAEDDELTELLPPAASKRPLRDLIGELKDVESVLKALQGADANLLDVRVWFDGLIAAKPSYARYLAPRADIVHRPDFEAGCVKVLKGQAKRLTRVEKAALERFLAAPPAGEGEQEVKDEEASISFVERLQKRRRLEEHQPCYELLASIPPTSNVVERFFSIARATFGLQRHALQPYTLEMLLFLRQNADYWDARTVESAE
ncbi:hypothetical protein PHYSODRAFT_340857 [Phytophthora sojae]|uniref:HAT C-terminal dimerisation domain-containing protein n=2 Tax=Phytophthora sojae (strain P6497) TaxID=1094619 RepID=G5ACX7_PHYSP|nr:hypothetical protein PHYSODRAFT_340857 [Phytophthora sojae]EGZ06639.1 hypothetical protein PHYSODRAFT_340857 [Phytophthora sojae]|eukprot:XP_009537403.1 hypothetical protein PHYSODRAFT_340857 [Phytophthora sojae]